MSAVIHGWFSSITLSLTFLAVTAWWTLYAYLALRTGHGFRIGSMVIPAIPLLVGTSGPVLAIYLSDVAYNYFYYAMADLNQPKSLAVLLILVLSTMLLQSISLEIRDNILPSFAIRRSVARSLQPLTLVLFAAMGVLQATAYLPPIGDDFLRYWSIADALRSGVPYPAMVNSESAYVSAGMTRYITDLPLYPAMLAGAFALFGHNSAAAYMPIVAANIVLPPLTFLLVRELIPDQITAVSLTSLVVLFPLLRFYTLNWPVPDAVFLAMLVACALLFVKAVRGSRSDWLWVTLGLTAAATALTRPEGLAYAVIYMMGALSTCATLRPRVLSAVAFMAPMGAFSLVLMVSQGAPWPHSLLGTIGPENFLGNLPVLVADQFLTSAIRLSSYQLALGWGILLALAFVGSLPILYRPRCISLLFLPAWINLSAVYMVDPRVSGSHLWFDFFRHVSYVMPLFIIAAGITATYAVHQIRSRGHRITWLLGLNFILVMLVLWNVHCLSEPSWNFGPDAVNLLSQARPNLVDYFEHAFSLPVLGFVSSSGYSVPIFPQHFITHYPDQVLTFYSSFDAVKHMSGTSYQTGSLFTFITAMILALVSSSINRGLSTESSAAGSDQ